MASKNNPAITQFFSLAAEPGEPEKSTLLGQQVRHRRTIDQLRFELKALDAEREEPKDAEGKAHRVAQGPKEALRRGRRRGGRRIGLENARYAGRLGADVLECHGGIGWREYGVRGRWNARLIAGFLF